MRRPAKPATVRFYFDADVLGLAKALVGLRNDITYPGDPGGVVHKRERPPCPVTDPATADDVWIPVVASYDWLIVTRDSRIQDHRAEIEAVRENDARMIALAGKEGERHVGPARGLHVPVAGDRGDARAGWPVHLQRHKNEAQAGPARLIAQHERIFVGYEDQNINDSGEEAPQPQRARGRPQQGELRRRVHLTPFSCAKAKPGRQRLRPSANSSTPRKTAPTQRRVHSQGRISLVCEGPADPRSAAAFADDGSPRWRSSACIRGQP